MKYFLFFLLLLSGHVFAQTSLYSLQIQTIDGKTISLANFKGKKIIFSVTSPEKLHSKKLNFLDSVQVANPHVEVIVIPAEDFSGSSNAGLLATIKNSAPSRLVVMGSAKVKKDKKAEQHELMKWLTDTTYNNHFNAEVKTDDQLYIVSESGILYSVLEKGVSLNTLNGILKQADIRQ